MTPLQAAELILILHAHAPDTVLAEITFDADMYVPPCPNGFPWGSGSQEEIASLALRGKVQLIASTISWTRQWRVGSQGFDMALLQVLRTLIGLNHLRSVVCGTAPQDFDQVSRLKVPQPGQNSPHSPGAWQNV